MGKNIILEQTKRHFFIKSSICVILMCGLLLALNGFLTPNVAKAATTYYVATTGNDISNTGTLSSPWRTIQKAADTMTPGDTVLIRGGTYEWFQIKYSGSTNNYITYKNYPGESVIIDSATDYYYDILIQSSSGYQYQIGWISIDGLEVRNATNNDIEAYNVHHLIMKNMKIHNSARQGVLICGSHDVIIDSNKIYSNGTSDYDHGIYATGNYYTVRNNVFYSNVGYGLQIAGYSTQSLSYLISGFDHAEHWTIENNTFAKNINGSGIVLYPGVHSDSIVDDINIENNIFYKNAESYTGARPNGVHFFGTPAPTNTTINYNIYNGVKDFIINDSGSTYTTSNNTSADPLFVDQANNDYHLQSTSPAIDTANSTYAPGFDLDGVSRPQGSGYDIGAYEYVGGTWYTKLSWPSGLINLGSGNTANRTVQFDLTPLDATQNATIGYADTSTTVDGYTKLAMIIQLLNTDGHFTVRNGAAYASLVSVSYSNNTIYHFRIEADMNAHTYTVYVTPQGGTETMIAQNYAFRSDAPATDDIGQLSLKSDTDNAYKVENHTIASATSATISPTTATFDKNTSLQSDVTVTMTPNGNTLNGLKNGANSLVLNTDYTVSGNTVVIKKGYLAAQPIGTTVLTFDFSAGTDPQLTVAVNNTWYTKAAWSSGLINLGTSNTGTKTVEFDLIPVDRTKNATIGYADTSTTVDGFSKLAMIIAMDNTQYYFTVRNGAAYAALTQISYSNNTTYHFRIVANMTAHTYTVYVTPQGGSETMIAQNYAFRSDAPVTDDIGQLSPKSDADDAYKVVNHKIY